MKRLQSVICMNGEFSKIDKVAFSSIKSSINIHLLRANRSCIMSVLFVSSKQETMCCLCVCRRSVIEAVYNRLNPHREEEGVS